MGDVDHIFEELIQIRKQLDGLPADAAEERARLEQRREELHEAAAGQADAADERPIKDIETELTSLKERLEAIEASEIDIVTQHGGSALEASSGPQTMDINRQIEAGRGADQLRERIRQLEGVLDGLGDSEG